MRRIPYAILGALAIAITACGGPASSGGGASAAPGQKTTLIIARSIGDAVSLDPQVAYEFSSVAAAHATYANLVTFEKGDATKPVGELAEKWESSSDNKTWTFHLKKGLVFASGNPVTAADVVYSFERVVNIPKDPASWLVTQWGITKDNVATAITASDPQTVKIALPEPFAPGAFLSILSFPTTAVVDSKIVKEHVEAGDFGAKWLTDHSAGGGPFVLDRWDRDNQIVLTANAKYNAGPKPAMQRVVFRHMPESTAQFDVLKKGDADIAMNLSAEQVKALGTNQGFTVEQSPDLALSYLGLDVKNVPAFGKVEVREAIKWAVDYDGITQKLLSGNAVATQGIIPKGMYGYTASQPFRQDLQKAKDLLKRAGYEKGFDVELLASTGSVAGGLAAADLAAKLKSDLAQIGINVTIRTVQSSELYKTYRAQKSQMVLAQWSADYPDPDNFAKPFADYTQKSLAWRLQWDDPELTKVVQQAGSVPNGDQRAKLYAQIVKAVEDSGPFVILYQPLATVAHASSVKNVFYNPVWGVDLRSVTKQ